MFIPAFHCYHHTHLPTLKNNKNERTGNPQSLKQQPLTYLRQVLSLVVNPALLEQHANLVRPCVRASIHTYLFLDRGSVLFCPSQMATPRPV
jgi:hypothetical protein